MKILLVNVDSKFNIAIRKMYNYYLSNNHDVTMIDLHYSAYPHNKNKIIDASDYDHVYVSNIFDMNVNRVHIKNCDNVEMGGIGSMNPEKKLQDEIETYNPFYFENETVSYGFITRGCIRNCWFCKVPKFEGRMKTYDTVENIVYSNPNMKRVTFMDNNILAHSEHKEIFKWLIDNNIKCDFNQGLDFRLVNEENLYLLSQLNYFGNYIFAFDDPKYEKMLNKKIALMKKYIPFEWKFKFYIYYHPLMNINLAIRRVEWCRENKCLPYFMRDIECWKSEDKNFLIDFAAYCNQPAFFKNISFSEFMLKRDNSEKRKQESINRYNDIIRNNDPIGLNVWDGKQQRY